MQTTTGHGMLSQRQDIYILLAFFVMRSRMIVTLVAFLLRQKPGDGDHVRRDCFIGTYRRHSMGRLSTALINALCQSLKFSCEKGDTRTTGYTPRVGELSHIRSIGLPSHPAVKVCAPESRRPSSRWRMIDVPRRLKAGRLSAPPSAAQLSTP